MFKTIIAAIDGSELSLEALEVAVCLARKNDAELQILTAVEPIPALATPEVPTYIAKYGIDLEEKYREIHDNILQRLSKQYPELRVTSQIKTGKPATVITEESNNCDLVVIGHRGHGRIMSWVLGSVAKSVVDSCTVPVLVVKKMDTEPELS